MDTVEFRVGTRAHITVDGDACRGCTTKACVTACPANLFVPISDGGILFNYEQCFECGTCYLVCNTAGRHRVDLSRRRPRRRLPPELTCHRRPRGSASPSSGSTCDPRSTR